MLQEQEREEAKLGPEEQFYFDGCQLDLFDMPLPDGPMAVGIDGGYQQRYLTYGADVLEADLTDTAALIETRPSGQNDMMERLEAFVRQAGPDEDARLIQHFHNWLRRQDFLLTGCGIASYNVGQDLQIVPER